MDNYHVHHAGPYPGYAGTNDQRSQIASMYESRVSPPQAMPAQQYYANGINEPSQNDRSMLSPSSITGPATTLSTFASGPGRMSAYDLQANANVYGLVDRRTSVLSTHFSPSSPSLSLSSSSSSSSSLSIHTSSPPPPPTVQMPYTQIKGQQQLYQRDTVSESSHSYLSPSSLTTTSLGSPPNYAHFMPSSPSSHPQSTVRLRQSLPSMNSSLSAFPLPSQQINPVQFQATAAAASQAHLPSIPSALTSSTHQAAPGAFNPVSLGPVHHGINSRLNYMPNIQPNLPSASQANSTLFGLPTNGATAVPSVMPTPATAATQLTPLRPPVSQSLMSALPVPGTPYALAGAGSTSQPFPYLQQHPTNHLKAQKPRKVLKTLGMISKAAGKVALYAAGGALSVTTGVSSQIVTEGGTAIANLFSDSGLVAALRRKAGNDGGVGDISEADIQAVVEGRPDANYQAVVRYLLIQQQIQQQELAQYQQSIATQHVRSRSVAQLGPAPGVDYQALIDELQRRQDLAVMQQAVMQQVAVSADSGPMSSPPQPSVVQQPMYNTGTSGVDREASLSGQIEITVSRGWDDTDSDTWT